MMEPRFGHDFSHVRVHTDARAAESAAALNAHAYTVGNHVVFGNGHYLPGTSSGQQLIAHELTHVVQQGSSPVAFGNSATVQRQPAPAKPAKPAAKPAKKAKEPPPKTYPVEKCPFPSDWKDDYVAGNQMMCVSSEAFEKNTKCDLTDDHYKLINVAKEAARKQVEKAERRMHWTGGPEYAARLAQKVFKGDAPDADTIQDILAKTLKILSGKMPFRGATCADPLCETPPDQHAVAYESGPTEPVAFCPRQFWGNYVDKMPRTIIHEAIHLAGVDIDPDIKELYCDGKGCLEQCQDATSAEAWTLFIDCLGGPLISALLITRQTVPPQYKPRTDFNEKTVKSVESEFGR
jgi:hypothetical protein